MKVSSFANRQVVRFAALSCFLVGSSAIAQLNRGALSGIVTDPSGAAIPAASVRVTNKENGLTTTTASTESGNYPIQGLQVGQYQFAVEAPGFKRFVTPNVIVTGGSNVRIDTPQELGNVTETVEVTTEVAPLQTQDAQVASAVNNVAVALVGARLHREATVRCLRASSGAYPPGSGWPTTLTTRQ